MSPFGKAFLSVVTAAGVLAFLSEGMVLWALGWLAACGGLYLFVKYGQSNDIS